MKRNKLLLCITIGMVLFLGSCKTLQKNTHAQFNNNIKCCELIRDVVAAQPSFKTMNISKMNISILYEDKYFSLKGSIRIATDSIISISLQPALGIELARVEITPDNFTVYNKFNRCYAQNDYEDLKLRWGIDINYKTIEALFSHKIFSVEEDNYKKFCKDFAITNMADTTTIVGTHPFGGMLQAFEISRFDNRLAMTGLQHNGKNLIAITYGELDNFNGIKFPKNVNVSIALSNPAYSVDFEINKITFNKPLTSSKINISKYTKTGLTDILSFK